MGDNVAKCLAPSHCLVTGSGTGLRISESQVIELGSELAVNWGCQKQWANDFIHFGLFLFIKNHMKTFHYRIWHLFLNILVTVCTVVSTPPPIPSPLGGVLVWGGLQWRQSGTVGGRMGENRWCALHVLETPRDTRFPLIFLFKEKFSELNFARLCQHKSHKESVQKRRRNFLVQY